MLQILQTMKCPPCVLFLRSAWVTDAGIFLFDNYPVNKTGASGDPCKEPLVLESIDIEVANN